MRHDHHVKQDLVNFLAKLEVKHPNVPVLYYVPVQWTRTDTFIEKCMNALFWFTDTIQRIVDVSRRRHNK